MAVDQTSLRRALRHRQGVGVGKEKIHTVLSEFKRGTLHSGSGGMVTSRPQAIAIALSEARKSGATIPNP